MKREHIPDYLSQGESARLFPVLSTTSKEGRTTSIVLACMSKVEEFGAELLQSLGKKLGKSATIETYTEIVLSKQTNDIKDRPDGLIVVKSRGAPWRALVEAKVGSSELNEEQLEKYRKLAKDNQIDCVISISNQFSTTPLNHPIDTVRKRKSSVPVFHWSWMHILTTADLLISADEVRDADQLVLLNELRRFLAHESAGVRGFDRMPKEWSELNRLVSTGGTIPAKSPLIQPVLDAWHQETKDLSLILSRMTGASVVEKLSRKHLASPSQRAKDELQDLRDQQVLCSSLTVPDAAATLDVVADLRRRTIDVGMTLRAPEDRKSTKARLNWLMRQIKTTDSEHLHIRLLWPGKSDQTQFSHTNLCANPDMASDGKGTLAPHSFHVFLSNRIGARFPQQTNFISELETLVSKFYGEIGSALKPWHPKAPELKSDRKTDRSVSPEGIAEKAEEFES
jgi:hypothetical protein